MLDDLWFARYGPAWSQVRDLSLSDPSRYRAFRREVARLKAGRGQVDYWELLRRYVRAAPAVGLPPPEAPPSKKQIVPW